MSKRKPNIDFSVWKEADIKFSNGVRFTIVHNIPLEHGFINSLDAALDNYLARLNISGQQPSQKGFIDYINSKGLHQAMTPEQFAKLQKQ